MSWTSSRVASWVWVAGLALGACRSLSPPGLGEPSPPPPPPADDVILPPPAPSPMLELRHTGAPDEGPDVLGAWVATAGGTDYALVFESGRATLARSDASGAHVTELAWSQDGERIEAHAAAGAVTASMDGESCMEVVSVMADELLVKVGKVEAGQCVLSDEVLHFARQVQR